MLFFERDIAIDLGTTTTQIYVSGKGIRLREASVVAVERSSGKLKKTGEEARRMLGRTPANTAAVQPIVSGVISDYDMTSQMLKTYIGRISSFSIFKPRVLMLVPGNITGVEERAIIDAVIEGGARKVYLLESSVATAVGAGVDVKKADGHLVVDIGSGTTEIAVVSLGGVAVSESIKIAGSAFDEAIVKYIRKKHNLLIGLRSAEELKVSIGGVLEREEVLYQSVKGRCLLTGLAREVSISSTEMIEALAEPMAAIIEAIQHVLERTAPELVSDISENGILLAGGGSLLWGIDAYIAEKTQLDAEIVDDPMSCTAYGAGRILDDLNDMQEGMINLARRKQLQMQ